MPRAKSTSTIAALVPLITALGANASVVFSTIPETVTSPASSNTFFSFTGSGFGGARVGYRFVPELSGGITQIEAWAYVLTTGLTGPNARFEIYSESQGLPGALVGSASVRLPAQMELPPSSPTPVHTLDGSIPIVANQPYFVVLAPITPTSSLAVNWWINRTLPPDVDITLCERMRNGSPWLIRAGDSFAGGIRISIPAPFSVNILVLGAVLMPLRRRILPE